MPSQASFHALTYQQSHTLIGVTCMLVVLCIAAVGGRLIARRVSRLRLEADDWICVAALVMFIGLCIDQFLVAHYGLLMAFQNPPNPNVLRNFVKVEFVSLVMYIFVTSAAKLSLLMLYRRIFSLRVRWFRFMWWANVGLVTALFATMIILNCTQCIPLDSIWNHPGSCIPNQTEISTTGFINAVIDLAILILPLRMVWSLQMSYKQKVAISGVFALGLIGVAISIARGAAITNPNLFKGGSLAFILWSTAEPAVGLICSCLPVLRSLYTAASTKVNSSRGRNQSSSKRSTFHESSAGPSSRFEDESSPNRSRSRSALASKRMSHKTFPITRETKMTVTYEELESSPVSSHDRPLPLAPATRQEEDMDFDE